MHTISLTDFKNDARGWIKHLQDHLPVVLTQTGRRVGVVQRYEAYRQTQNTLAMLEIVAQGEADVRADRLITHEQVMAEARAVIETAAVKPSGKPCATLRCDRGHSCPPD